MAAINIQGKSTLKMKGSLISNCGVGLRIGSEADVEIEDTHIDSCGIAVDHMQVNPVMTEESKAIFEELKRILAALDNPSTRDIPEAMHGAINSSLQELRHGEKWKTVIKKHAERFGSKFADIAKTVSAALILDYIRRM
jgi:hypothetical protein